MVSAVFQTTAPEGQKAEDTPLEQRIFESVRLTRACSKLARAAIEPFEPKIAGEIAAWSARFRQQEFTNNEDFAGNLADLRDSVRVLAGAIRHYDLDDTRTTDQLVDELLDLVDELEAFTS